MSQNALYIIVSACSCSLSIGSMLLRRIILPKGQADKAKIDNICTIMLVGGALLAGVMIGMNW